MESGEGGQGDLHRVSADGVADADEPASRRTSGAILELFGHGDTDVGQAMLHEGKNIPRLLRNQYAAFRMNGAVTHTIRPRSDGPNHPAVQAKRFTLIREIQRPDLVDFDARLSRRAVRHLAQGSFPHLLVEPVRMADDQRQSWF